MNNINVAVRLNLKSIIFNKYLSLYDYAYYNWFLCWTRKGARFNSEIQNN